MQTAAKVKCAIYARVSTDQQGDSLENQIGQCQEFISRLGDQYDREQIAIYKDEAVSGYYTSVFERAEMKRAIGDAKKDAFKLLVFKEVSRVGRDKQENPAIIGMFEQYGVRVIAINDHYDSLNRDNITFDILSVLSEQESKKISARVSSARKQKARRGQWNGEPPIGYKLNPNNKKLEIDPDWSHIPALIFELYVDGGLGTFRVAEHLNKLGCTTRHMNKWSRESVNKVLRNQAYVGNVVYGTRRNLLKREYDDTGKMNKRKVQVKLNPSEWQIVEGAHEGLIDRETFRQAQNILTSRSRNAAPKRASHPLTGLLYCGHCSEGMVCQKRTYNGKTYRYYICKTYHKYGRSVCRQANMNADQLEEAVLEVAGTKWDQFPLELMKLTVHREHERIGLERSLQHAAEMKKRLMQEQIELFRQRSLFAADVYEHQMLGLKSQIEQCELEIGKLEAQSKNFPFEKEDCSELLRDMFGKFKTRSMNELQSRRVYFHEIIRQARLKDSQLTIEYRFDYKR